MLFFLGVVLLDTPTQASLYIPLTIASIQGAISFRYPVILRFSKGLWGSLK